jgi:polyisoprenoid-binding protein YceI
MVLVAAGLPVGGAGAIQANPLTLPVDPARSEITFRLTRPGEVVEGTAPGAEGEVRFDPRDPGDGAAVTLRIEAVALETGNRLRDRTMRRKHLEVTRHPEIIFRSTSIEIGRGTEPSKGEGEAVPGRATPLAAGESRRAMVGGDLLLHGVQRSILFPVSIRYDSGLLEVEGEVSFRLTDHAIPIPRFLWLVLDDEVTIAFRVVAGESREPDGKEQERHQ